MFGGDAGAHGLFTVDKDLDPGTGEGIMRLLDRINKTGTTVVMATHDQRIVNTMRKRVIQLDRGIIVRDQARGVYE